MAQQGQQVGYREDHKEDPLHIGEIRESHEDKEALGAAMGPMDLYGT